MVAAIARQNPAKAPVPSFMLKDSPCVIGLKKNEPALKAKVDALIEQGIKDGTLNALSQQWLKAPVARRLFRIRSVNDGTTSFFCALAALAGAAGRAVGDYSTDGHGHDRRPGYRHFGGRHSQRRPSWLSRIWGGYVELIRNTPFVVQLFFIVFGLPNLGLKMTAGEAALLAMVVNLGAYSTEIGPAPGSR